MTEQNGNKTPAEIRNKTNSSRNNTALLIYHCRITKQTIRVIHVVVYMLALNLISEIINNKVLHSSCTPHSYRARTIELKGFLQTVSHSRFGKVYSQISKAITSILIMFSAYKMYLDLSEIQ